MKIALHGHGKMGQAVERVARELGHEVSVILSREDGERVAREVSVILSREDGERVARELGHEVSVILSREDGEGSPSQERGGSFDTPDVLIDFSHASALDRALDLATQHKLDLVIGTTGWNDRVDEVRQRVDAAGIACVYASNFSPGANVVFALARRAGELFARFPQYAVGIEERHHSQKKDVPSGTALRIRSELGRDVPIASSRVGAEFGLHTLFFDSPDDLVEISHRARGREGFARGAVFAAELVRGRKGLFRFEELLFRGEEK